MRVKRLVAISSFILVGWLLLSFGQAPHILAYGGPDTDGTGSTVKLAQLGIDVWPEYDNTQVLVQYDGIVEGQDNLPKEITFYIPSGAQIYAAAYVDSNGQMLNAGDWKVQDAGDGFARVTFPLPGPHFHLEYYYDALKGSPNKTMEFAYKALQPALQVHLEIQEPLNSTQFATNPPSNGQTAGQHGFKYENFDYATLAQDQVVKVQVSYTKADTSPSVANITPPANTTTQTSAAVTSTENNYLLPAGLIAVGLSVGALGGLAWWSRRRSSLAAPEPAAAGARRRRHEAGASFCVKCGRVLHADDNFCSRCGTPKRG